MPLIFFVVLPFLQVIVVVDGVLETAYLMSAIFSATLSPEPSLSSGIQLLVDSNLIVPPDFIFGIIWPYNFVILGVAAVTVANKLSTPKTLTYLSIFALSVICALTWSYQFYGPHNLVLASSALVGTAVLTIPMLYLIYQASVGVFIATLPYQIWVIIASYLSSTYAKLN